VLGDVSRPPARAAYTSPLVLTISAATAVTDELVDSIARLLPLLSSSAPAPTAEELQAIVSSPATTLLVARDSDDAIVGTLTLAVFRIPSGVRAWIEDVIVSTAARGRGCGEALTRAALEAAAEAGAHTVDLTSRPSREAANRLYQRLGFVSRETNVYRYELG
jgi:ribosomal protein S18 acetylase RimI-like enzyme